MRYNTLGDTGLRVSALGLGCSRIGRSVFNDNRKHARDLLAAAVDAGINFFDTAPSYAYGDSERLLGEVFAARRDRLILATKGGFRYSSTARYAQYLLPLVRPFRKSLNRQRVRLKRRSRKRQDFSIEFLRDSLERSLRRLRTDYVDLYQLHSPSASVIESAEVLRFLEDLQKDGKVRFCAASVNTAAEAQLCLKFPVFSALQISFNLADRAPATEVFPLARSKRVGVIVKMPLARGLLTERHRIMTGPEPERFIPELQHRRRRALEFLLSDNHPSVEIASLRFILDHLDVASVLMGTTSPEHLRNNIRAIEAPPLSEDLDRNHE